MRLYIAWALFFALMSLPGCATVTPLFDRQTAPSSDLTLRASTAVGDRLSLTLDAPDAEPGDRLILTAGHLDAPLTDILLDAPQARALNHALLTVEHPLGDRARTWAFEASLIPADDQRPTHRQSLTLDWPGPLSAPTLSLDHRDQTVSISWTFPSDAPRGVIIARRDILADGPFLPLAALPPCDRAYFDDSLVKPDGVYAYRLQAWQRHEGFERRSQPSEDLFIAP